MTTYTVPSVESILEDSEDEGRVRARDQEELPTHHRPRSHESTMKANSGREREKSRKHKSIAANKHSKKSKTGPGKMANTPLPKGNVSDSSRRHQSNRSASPSTSSSEEEGENNHPVVLAVARARLTSPSTISNLTSQTTATNRSSSSSGSNSTITQASVTKRMSLAKRPDIAEEPLSPAVPDPPTNVFAFLEKDSQNKMNEENHISEYSRWAFSQTEHTFAAAPVLPKDRTSSTSSTSSSFQGDDNSSEPVADNDTDRSSSPDNSVKGPYEGEEVSQRPPTDQISAKYASQMAAATQRQNIYAMEKFGTPEMPRGNVNLPHVPSSNISARYPQQVRQQLLPRAEKLPVTGYEALASRLASSANVKSERIKPMYRKFEVLNHRLLLHLQDELSELEEQLHHLDNADTQSRRMENSIQPASRRAAAQAGGNLEWAKVDLLGRIGFKLNQYNAALASFNSTQSLAPPAPSDIDQYRSYLQDEHPIAEWETHFLDPTDDLVSLYSEHLLASSQSESSYNISSGDSFSVAPSTSSNNSSPVPSKSSSSAKESRNKDVDLSISVLPAVATAIAIAVLVPIITFNVIPAFLGRMTVALLVCLFMVWALIQSKTIERSAPLGREGMTCLAIYGGVMTVIAGIMS